MMMPLDKMRENADHMADMLRAMANSARLLILCRLSAGEASVGELIEATQLGQSAVSQHLATLREAGAVAARADKQSRIYSIVDPQVRSIFDSLCDICADGEKAA
ncbi:DNA-binding transcriptional ArsR family regulator [Stakelama sediminis]|uniref:DNA-binding transcriptional ArsR family regulator n=1 Tax=Stakelama sediminis TaxID=463200 RepID=A0A840YYK5_9SPHN|nr:metalloregulator ArsR/SmtB family transcription factor [Stakelama sediminis]MBB5718610.1 DNA-binding transcriptional ArsR family regulator [Stakelama sediminis]